MAAFVALLALCAAFLKQTEAHGGVLHRWSFRDDVKKTIQTADIRNNVNVHFGTCSDWTTLNYSAVSALSYVLPYFEPTLNYSINGTIDLYSYLDGTNCSNAPTVGLFPMLKIKEWTQVNKKWVGKAPAANTVTTFAYAFSGSCDAPGNMYRNNVTLQDNRFNLLWWNGANGYVGEGMNSTDTYPGWVWGADINAWLPRVTSEYRILSIVIITKGGPAFCCTTDYIGYPAPESVLDLGTECAIVGDDD